MADASDVVPEADETAKLGKLEELAARAGKKAKKARVAKEERAENKKAGWERKGRNPKGQKAHDFNSNSANGSFVSFDEDSVASSRRVKGAYKEEIYRDHESGEAMRARSWVGGVKQKVEFTEERINKESGQREDVRIRKEKQSFYSSKNVDYNWNASKTIERGTRRGTFSISYTNNFDGSRTLNGVRIGPFKINRSTGEDGAKSLEVGFGKSLSYSTLTEPNGQKTRRYRIGNAYSRSTTVNSNGELVRSEKRYFDKRTKTVENTGEGEVKYTTTGRSVNDMKVAGLDDTQIEKAIQNDIAAGNVYRLRRTDRDGNVTRDYNRQTYKGKVSDYIAGDDHTHDTSLKTSAWGLSKTTSESLSREQIEARRERQAQLEVETITSTMPGAFPSELSEADKRIVRNASAASRTPKVGRLAGTNNADAASLSSAASRTSSLASFATATAHSVRGVMSKIGTADRSSSSEATPSKTSLSHTATTVVAEAHDKMRARLEGRLDERKRSKSMVR